jgi:glycerol-3-phosphate acyltransferase PlsX
MGHVYRATSSARTTRASACSVGEEEGKGNELRREAFEGPPLSINFIGNIEGRDNGRCDVVVTDGFTGNVCLKGLGEPGRR